MRASDDELIDRSRAGDRDAYGELLARHQLVALRIGYAIAGDDAEDAVQEAMVKAFRHLDRFRTGAPFRPWFLAIVTNEAHNRRRDHSRHRTLELRVTTNSMVRGDAPSAEDGAVRNGQRAMLLTAFARLPDRDREVVALRYFAELSEAETAQTLGCAIGTVKSRLSRAVGRLRITLGEESHD